MNETNISFYLKANRIHVFVDALRALGSPTRICFMIDESGKNLLLSSYDKRDFRSHSVPPEVYAGLGGMEVCSAKLCRIIAELHQWDLSRSYRVPGKAYPEFKIAIFQLIDAEMIDHEELE